MRVSSFSISAQQTATSAEPLEAATLLCLRKPLPLTADFDEDGAVGAASSPWVTGADPERQTRDLPVEHGGDEQGG